MKVFRPILGGERIARLNDDHYTAELYAIAQQLDVPMRFARFAQLAPQIAMSAFARRFDTAHFGADLAAAAEHVRR